MSFEKGIFIVGIEYNLQRSSKNPKVGSDVSIRVFLLQKFTSNKSRIWSEPLPTPIIEGETLRFFDNASISFSILPSGYSLTSEIFFAQSMRSL